MRAVRLLSRTALCAALHVKNPLDDARDVEARARAQKFDHE